MYHVECLMPIKRVVLSQLECENCFSFDLHLFSNESALRKLVSPFFHNKADKPTITYLQAAWVGCE